MPNYAIKDRTTLRLSWPDTEKEHSVWVTWDQFKTVNPDLDLQSIREALRSEGQYRGGGGAQPVWELRLEDSP